MREMPEEDFLKLIEAAHELRTIEFKPPFSWTDDNSIWLREKVIQTILGLANTPDGGFIIIGIGRDEHGSPTFDGLTSAQLESFSDYDSVKGKVDGFTYTSVSFDISKAPYEDNIYVVIRVGEFDEIPVICKKTSDNTEHLRQGDVYCRSKSGPPSTIRVTESEMLEIIRKASDKHQEQLRRRGWQYVGPQEDIAGRVETPTEENGR